MKSSYLIRQVDEADCEIAATLEELHRNTFVDGTHLPTTSDGDWAGDWWLAFYGDPRDHDPAGFAGLVKSDRYPQTGYLCRVGVLKQHRGNGLQRRFIRAIERKALRNGWGQIVTDTTSNPASANSFIACGWKTFVPTTPWGFRASVYWQKFLEG